MQCDDILKKLKSLSSPRAMEGMAKYGIVAEKAYGVSIPNLRKLVKKIGKDRKLAQ
jgi:3-methyladenine DNA glycosylase AlkD